MTKSFSLQKKVEMLTNVKGNTLNLTTRLTKKIPRVFIGLVNRRLTLTQ